MRKMLGGSSEKAAFQIQVTGDEQHAFATTISASGLKESLKDHLLVPFIQQVKHDKGTNIACSKVDVNGNPVETMEELMRPLKDYHVPGDTTVVTVTLELVEEIQKRRKSGARAAMSPSARPKMSVYAVESVGSNPIDGRSDDRGPQLGTSDATRSPTATEAAMNSQILGRGGGQSSGNLFFIESDAI